MKNLDNQSAIAAPDQLSARFRQAISLALIAFTITFSIPRSLAAMSNALKRDKSLGADMENNLENIEDIKALQAALAELGLYKGVISGEYDEQTIAAVRELQSLLRSINPAYLAEINGNFDTATRLAIFKFQVDYVHKEAPEYGKMNGTGWLGNKTVKALQQHTSTEIENPSNQASQAIEEDYWDAYRRKKMAEASKYFQGFAFSEGENSPWNNVLRRYYEDTGSETWSCEDISTEDAASLARQIESLYFDYLDHMAKTAAQNADKNNRHNYELRSVLSNMFQDRCYANRGDVLDSFEGLCTSCPEIAKHFKKLNKQKLSKIVEEIDDIFLRTARVNLPKVLDEYKMGKRRGILRNDGDTTNYVVSAACVALKLVSQDSGEDVIEKSIFNSRTGDRPNYEMQEVVQKLGQADGYWGPEAIKALLAQVEEACQKLDQQEKNRQKAANPFNKPAKNFQQPENTPKPSSNPANKNHKNHRR